MHTKASRKAPLSRKLDARALDFALLLAEPRLGGSDRLPGSTPPLPAGLCGATTGGSVDREQSAGGVQRPERLGAVQAPRDGVDGGGGGVVGRVGGGASQRGVADLEDQATSPRLEDPAWSEESRLSDARRRTDWQPAEKFSARLDRLGAWISSDMIAIVGQFTRWSGNYSLTKTRESDRATMVIDGRMGSHEPEFERSDAHFAPGLGGRTEWHVWSQPFQ